MIDFTKVFILSLIGIQAIAQEVKPYWYNDKFIFTDQPVSAKEYGYDYTTKEEKLVENHTFTYTPQGKIATHVESNEGISSWFQIFRYRFSYDEAERLIYYWSEQYSSFNNSYTSQREEQWVYDSFGMLTEYNNWSVTNGTKYQGADSYKRKITREQGSNKVQKIVTRTYSTFESAFELTDSLEFKYKVDGKLDTLKIYKANMTWGGRMDLEETRYNIDLSVENYTNTDLIRYDGYTYEDWYPSIHSKEFTYDAKARLISEITKDDNGAKESEVLVTYEADKVTTVENNYEKTISYLDPSGLEYKKEVYSNNSGTWELDAPSYTLKTRTFAENKLSEELVQNYSSSTSSYEKDARYTYTYSGALGIADDLPALDVYVSPNPTTGNLTISNSDRISSISLIKTDGTIKTIGVSSSILLNENPGCYLLRMTGKEGNYSDHKIVIY